MFGMTSGGFLAIREFLLLLVSAWLSPRVLRPRDFLVRCGRREEHRHGRPGELTVPEPARTDEDGACMQGHVRRLAVGEHGHVDVARERVEQLVAGGVA